MKTIITIILVALGLTLSAQATYEILQDGTDVFQLKSTVVFEDGTEEIKVSEEMTKGELLLYIMNVTTAKANSKGRAAGKSYVEALEFGRLKSIISANYDTTFTAAAKTSRGFSISDVIVIRIGDSKYSFSPQEQNVATLAEIDGTNKLTATYEGSQSFTIKDKVGTLLGETIILSRHPQKNTTYVGSKADGTGLKVRIK